MNQQIMNALNQLKMKLASGQMPEMDTSMYDNMQSGLSQNREKIEQAYNQYSKPRERDTMDKIASVVGVLAPIVALFSNNKGVDRAMGALTGMGLSYTNMQDRSHDIEQRQKLNDALSMLTSERNDLNTMYGINKDKQRAQNQWNDRWLDLMKILNPEPAKPQPPEKYSETQLSAKLINDLFQSGKITTEQALEMLRHEKGGSSGERQMTPGQKVGWTQDYYNATTQDILNRATNYLSGIGSDEGPVVDKVGLYDIGNRMANEDKPDSTLYKMLGQWDEASQRRSNILKQLGIESGMLSSDTTSAINRRSQPPIDISNTGRSPVTNWISQTMPPQTNLNPQPAVGDTGVLTSRGRSIPRGNYADFQPAVGDTGVFNQPAIGLDTIFKASGMSDYNEFLVHWNDLTEQEKEEFIGKYVK